MTPEQIEAVRVLRAWAKPMFGPLSEQRMAASEVLDALDHLTKANDELQAEAETMRQMRETAQELGYEDVLDALEALSELRAEVEEQARLNGMGAEHELSLRATIDRLTKERDEARAQFDNHVVWASGQAAELEAKVARLTKGRDSFAASYTHAAEERDEARTSLSAMQEGIDEAVRRAALHDPEYSPRGAAAAKFVTEPLRPFATKPEVEVDPLVALCTELFAALRRYEADSDPEFPAPPEHREMMHWAEVVLAARGGRVVFDGRDG